MHLDALLIETAVEDVVRPKDKARRVWLTIQEIEILLPDKERYVADWVCRPPDVLQFRHCQVEWLSDAVLEITADVRLHQLVRKLRNIPMCYRRAAREGCRRVD